MVSLHIQSKTQPASLHERLTDATRETNRIYIHRSYIEVPQANGERATCLTYIFDLPFLQHHPLTCLHACKVLSVPESVHILQEKLSGAPSGVNVARLGLPMDPVVPPPAPPVDTTPAAVPVVAEPAPAAVPVEGGLTLPPEAPPASSEDFDHIPVPVPVGEDIAEAPPAAVPVGEGVAEAGEGVGEAPPAAVPVGEDIAEAPPAAVPGLHLQQCLWVKILLRLHLQQCLWVKVWLRLHLQQCLKKILLRLHLQQCLWVKVWLMLHLQQCLWKKM